MTALRLEERRGLPALAALAPAWADLSLRDSRATPFQRPEWLLPYCRAFGVREPWAVALFRGPRLAALAAIVEYEEGGRRIATLLGGGRSDRQDALVDPDLAPDGARVLLARIVEQTGACDALVLERLPADGWLAAADLPTSLPDGDAADEEPCPAVELPGDAAALAARLAPHVVENARYGRRRLARAGDVEWIAADGENLAAHLAALFSLHAARWAARGEGGVLADARVRSFHEESARALAGAGLLREYRLAVGGRDVAVWHGLALGNRWFYYLGGFDPAWRAASPGTVILLHAAEEAIRASARRLDLDLGRGRERYKYAWGAIDRGAVRRVWWPGARAGEERGVAASGP